LIQSTLGAVQSLKDVVRIGAGQGWHDGISALGEDELAVANPRLAARSLHADVLADAINLNSLYLDQDLDFVADVEAFRRLEQELEALVYCT
jgi:hypothetical protein